MIKIRLSQTGKKHKRSYRIVVADSKEARNGKNLEVIGWLNFKTSPPVLKINKERLNYWLNHGAKLSEPLIKIIENEKTS